MPALLLQHVRNGKLRNVEETGEIDVEHVAKVVSRVVGERLADKDSGIVDERVDPSESFDGGVDDACRDLTLSNLSGHGDHMSVLGLLDVAGIRDQGISEI